MNKRKEKGNSLLNAILIVLIICACGVIYFLIKSGDTGIQSGYITNQNGIQPYYPYTEVEKNTTIASNSEVKLSNKIPYENAENTSTTPPISTNTYDRYFYNQLKDFGKGMYNAIVDNTSALKNGYDTIDLGTSQENYDSQFQSSWDAISMDRPEIFYVDTKKVSLITKTSESIIGKKKYQYSLQPQKDQNYFLSCWTTANSVQSAINEVESNANQVLNNAKNYSSTYEKVKYIHDYIIENTEYNQQTDVNNSDIYGCLIKKRVVCEGYAKTFKYLLDHLGIPCIMVCGNGIGDDGNSEFHAWNYVMMDDGYWYAVDSTWDDPIIIGNGTISDSIKHRYFLVGSNNFFENHHEDGDVSGTGQAFKYPEISKTDYKR